MSKRRISAEEDNETFGPRLARLRKAVGLTQTEFAKEIGISQRMVSYYEIESEFPPGALLPLISKVLNVSTDILLGVDSDGNHNTPKDSRLWRRFKKIEQLPGKERRNLIQIIDRFLELNRLKTQTAIDAPDSP